MKTKYILLGDEAITAFLNEDWSKLEQCILKDFRGDIVSWNLKWDFSELLEMLKGWNNFIELSKESLYEIVNNTKIEMFEP